VPTPGTQSPSHLAETSPQPPSPSPPARSAHWTLSPHERHHHRPRHHRGSPHRTGTDRPGLRGRAKLRLPVLAGGHAAVTAARRGRSVPGRATIRAEHGWQNQASLPGWEPAAGGDDRPQAPSGTAGPAP
jgi:hypothetical protein